MPDDMKEHDPATHISSPSGNSFASMSKETLVAHRGRDIFSGKDHASYDPLSGRKKSRPKFAVGDKYYHKDSKKEVTIMGAANDGSGKLLVKLDSGVKAKCLPDRLVKL